MLRVMDDAKRMWELWLGEETRKIQLREDARRATLDAKQAAVKAPKPPRLGKQLEPIEPTDGRTPVPKGRQGQGRRRQAS